MKVIILFIFITFQTISFTQVQNLDYCYRIKLDQSNTGSENLSSEENKEQYKLRSITFKENYEILKKSFLKENFKQATKDSCYRTFLQLTLIHNAQAYPQDFFSKENIAFIANIIENSMIQKEDVAIAVNFM